ncbi:TolC family outer membrane protein [Herminiimonas fonticola]|uniref:Outer membrane protein n=1 Tax=Herminiimonas fonticola TaxID=303380 RepID=A0A4R6GH75_9BURK|nr:TolC family outer membrane protein [Herminiimonas fonticola]RBA25206.1 type I secretion outer membrane protein, TolC family [Herminiimonas fonticola]TDN94321.1 outer membrane protein [Herminiimonas fonticola]
MRNAKLVTLITGAFLTLQVHAVNLLQVYQDALANDAVYASARANLSAGQEASVQGRANLLPLIGLSGSKQKITREDLPDTTSHGYTLSLSQPLFDIAAWQTYEQSKLSVAASEAAFASVQQDLILRVAQAYFDVLTAQDALTALQAQKVAISEQLASAKRNFEVGTATITDTHEAQSRYDLVVAQEFAAQNDIDIKRTALQQIIGKPPENLAILRKDVDLKQPEPAQIAPWVSSAEEQNYDVISKQLALEIAKRDITRNRAGHYPTVDLVASRSNTNQRNTVLGQTSTGTTNTVGVQWAIPLFSGFAVTSQVRQSIALEDKARSDLESSRRTAALNARQSYLGVNSGLAQVKALKAAEISSLSSLESNRLGYQVGVRINIDVLNAQQQLYQTQRDLAKTRYDTVMNSLRLKSAAGSLQEKDLVQINTILVEPAQP